ncbi:hypothetical protein N8861_03680 [Porticoccus sp.]|nr:hypothetical protein [Porticoccus sp.]
MGSGRASSIFQFESFERPSRKGKRSGSNKEPPKAGMRMLSCSTPPYTARKTANSLAHALLR